MSEGEEEQTVTFQIGNKKFKEIVNLNWTISELKKCTNNFKDFYFEDQENDYILERLEQKTKVREILIQNDKNIKLIRMKNKDEVNQLIKQNSQNIQQHIENEQKTDKIKIPQQQEPQINENPKNQSEKNESENIKNESELICLLDQKDIKLVLESKYIKKEEGMHYVQYPCYSIKDLSEIEQKSVKTILLVGQTGSGKSTMVDVLVNYLQGVEINYPFRYKVVDEENLKKKKGNSLSQSQTQEVQSYIIKSNKMDYSICIIDTPGFMDTAGKETDMRIATLIYNHFRQSKLSRIDCVCFISNSSQGRLTVSQKYLYNRILEIFGKDIAPNIVNLLTFSDNGKPQVIESLEAQNIPHNHCFKFNNYAIMQIVDDNIGQYYYKMGVESLIEFFKVLENLPQTSVYLTIQVLKEREEILDHINTLKLKIMNGAQQQQKQKQEFEQMESIIAQIQCDINVKHKQFLTKLIPSSSKNINCQKCHQTCYKYCSDSFYQTIKERCRICQCEHYYHHYQSFYYEQQDVIDQDLQQKLKCLQIEQEYNVSKLAQTLLQNKKEIINDLLKIQSSFDKLQSISICNNKQNVNDILDNIIKDEELIKKPGFKIRIQAFKYLQEVFKQYIQAEEENNKEAIFDILHNKEKAKQQIKQKNLCLCF